MAWYKTGTVSIVSGATSVSATGTTFATNARVGDGFRGPNGQWYEILNIASDTVLGIYPAYAGPTISNSSSYMIAPLQGYNKETADRLRAITDSISDLFTDSMVDGGNISLSGGVYPTVPDHSTMWKVTVAGTVAGTVYSVGDILVYSKVQGSFYKIDNTVTKADVGLGNVDNTSDVNKPVSTAQATAIATKQAASTKLTALSSIDAGADRVPIFTSATTAYYLPAGTVGKSILAAVDESTAREVLSLGTVSTLDATTSSVDSTPNRVLKVGDFGIGAIGPNVTPNTALIPGIYRFPGGASGAPAALAGGLGSLIVNSLGGNLVQQICMSIPTTTSNPYIGMRHFDSSGVPGPWVELFHKANAVGIVSQSGGVPTGAIVETGSNASGYYTKLLDGTLICQGIIADFSVAANAIATVGSTATFPATFLNSLYFITFSGTATASNDVYGFTGVNTRTTTSSSGIYRNGATAQNIGNGRYLAVGRWY